MKKIVIIDGQGGRLGKLLVEETRAKLTAAQDKLAKLKESIAALG